MNTAVQAGSYPSRNFYALPEHDTNLLPGDIRGVYCLTSGNCVVENWSGVEVTIPMTAGMTVGINPMRLKVSSTGTYLGLR